MFVTFSRITCLYAKFSLVKRPWIKVMLHARSTVITWISYPVQFPRRSESNEREKLFLANAKRTKRKKKLLD